MNTKIKQNTKAIILGLVVAIGAGYASAWTGPTASPTGGNVAAPINIGDMLQTKSGILNLVHLNVTDLTVATGSPTIGQVLTAVDSTGRVGWGNGGTTGGGLGFGTRNDRTNDNTADTVAFNTVYQAQTDGIVYASIDYGSNWPVMVGYTDSSSNPTTPVIHEGPDDDGGNSSMSFPVKKGDYWKVALNGNYSNQSINWMPIVPVAATSLTLTTGGTATSTWYQIGNLLIESGTNYPGTGRNTLVTFPKPFGNITSINISMLESGTGGSQVHPEEYVHATNITNTSFYAGTANNDGYSWTAIGTAP